MNGEYFYVYVFISFKMIIVENWALFISNQKSVDNISANQKTNLS